MKRSVVIVEDEPLARKTLREMLAGVDWLEIVGEAADGLAAVETINAQKPDLVFLDVQMPGQSGIDLLKALKAEDYPAPIFIVSGSGDIPTAVEAIKSGAFDFIEKPVKASTVVTRVREAVEAWSRKGNGDLPHAFPGHDQLTARERDVLAQIAAGSSNKQAGRELGISPRTIEVHRARIMEKLGARNAADLMRIVLSEGRA